MEMEIHNKLRFSLISVRWLLWRNQTTNDKKNTNGRKNSRILLVGIQNSTATMQIRVETTQNAKNKTTIWSNYTTPEYKQREKPKLTQNR